MPIFINFLFKHFVAYSIREICIHTKRSTKDILQASAYITPEKFKKTHKNKHEMIVHLSQKLGEEKNYRSLLMRIL